MLMTEDRKVMASRLCAHLHGSRHGSPYCDLAWALILVATKGMTGVPEPDETPTQWAKRTGISLTWEHDDPRDHVAEFPDAYDKQPDACLVATVYDSEGDVLTSLGCIDDPSPEYRVEVETDLINEAFAEAQKK